MNNRERVHAILHYREYDRMPVVHFGYWRETLDKWAAEGHITVEQAQSWGDGNPTDAVIAEKLGFDFNWSTAFSPATRLRPAFETKVIETFADGSRHVMNDEGTIILEKDNAVSIPKEIEHLLTDRASWEELYLPKLQFEEERITHAYVNCNGVMVRYDQGGSDYLKAGVWDNPYGLHVGSLFGVIRNWLGIVGLSYLMVDDPDLLIEIIDTVGDLCYQTTKYTLEHVGAQFDFAHFWEDISFKSGPLISPRYFKKHVGPHYKRITELVNSYGMDIVSLDSDGKIDQLIPTWFENGVNTMFPIEVGTWGSNIAPWRETFGRELRGVGGMNKVIFSRDVQAIDAEIARMKALVELGGYIPCPDHRLAPDAIWENVQYYCNQMHETFD
ncbi:MAG: uroporphyrinogen decarboxylase family protein [Anaerolineae bacterium]|nr:uroporphyrinogen decarboxylase family protein [Anaerolineae bacterium]